MEDAREGVKDAKADFLAAKVACATAREAKRLARKALTPTIKKELAAIDVGAVAEWKLCFDSGPAGPVAPCLEWVDDRRRC